MSNNYTIKSHRNHRGSITSIRVDVKPEALVFTEQLEFPDMASVYEGRSLRVNSIEAFEKAIGHPLADLDKFMLPRQKDGKLDLDFLHRLCERHRLPYVLSGKTLSTAYARYRSERETLTRENYARGASIFAHAMGSMVDFNPDRGHIISMLTEAKLLGYTRAYYRLAEQYYNMGEVDKAIAVAEEGIHAGDGRSMIAMAKIYSDGTLHRLSKEASGADNISRAAEMYIAASKEGQLSEAVEGISRLIDLGLYTPKANTYMAIISLGAKAKRQAKEDSLARVPDDPQLQKAHRLLHETPTNAHRALRILQKAFDEGELRVCEDLFMACMMLEYYSDALRNAHKAVEAGVPEAMFHLAKLYFKGVKEDSPADNAGDPDYENTVRWCIRAIEEGEERGEELLASLEKRGVRIDFDKIIL